MKLFSSVLVLSSVLSSLVAGSPSTQISPVENRNVKATTQYPLPPVALPGILRDFKHLPRQQERFLTELRFLKNGMPQVDRSLIRKRRSQVDKLIRKKRSLDSPNFMPSKLKFMGAGMKRDLRRLRRDLNYGLTREEVLPRYQQQQQQRIPERLLNRPMPEEEYNRLLRGLKLLDELAQQRKQEHLSPLMASQLPEEPLLPSTSRFGPQLKPFTDETQRYLSPHMGRSESERDGAKYPEGYATLLDKRWPKPGAWGGLSRLPGIKRSVFREASRQENLRKAHGIVKRGHKENVQFAPTYSGRSSVDSDTNRIRRTIM